MPLDGGSNVRSVELVHGGFKTSEDYGKNELCLAVGTRCFYYPRSSCGCPISDSLRSVPATSDGEDICRDDLLNQGSIRASHIYIPQSLCCSCRLHHTAPFQDFHILPQAFTNRSKYSSAREHKSPLPVGTFSALGLNSLPTRCKLIF